MLTLTNRIDMRPGAVPLVIHLGQYDSDFSLVFELYSSAGNFTVESGTTAMIRGTKTDGHAYDADATIDVSAKTVTVAGNEQMTAAKGRNVYELVLKKGTKVLSTANFILDVERAAMDADTIASESVLKELNAIIDSAATSTQAAADAASAADRAEDAADSVSSASTQIATNTADIADLKADLSEIFSNEAKEALLACFAHVAWDGGNGQQYYDVLESALYSEQFPQINAVFDAGSNVIYAGTSVDAIKQYLTVKYYDSYTSPGTVVPSTDYRLSGSLITGQNTIIVSYNGYTTTFKVFAEYPYYYELPEATAFDGVDDGITLNDLNLLDRDKDYSIVFDFTENEFDFTTSRYTVFRMRNSASTSNVLIFQAFPSNGETGYQLQAFGSSPDVKFAGLNNKSVRHVRGCLSHIANSGAVKWNWNVDEENRIGSGNYSFAVSDYGMTVGCGYLGSDADNRNNFFKGTINEFKILKYAMTDSEMSAYIGGV